MDMNLKHYHSINIIIGKKISKEKRDIENEFNNNVAFNKCINNCP